MFDRPIRVAALMEAASVTGPAKNLIEFGRRAHSGFAGQPSVHLSVVTYHRGACTRDSSPNAFVEAVRAAGLECDVIQERSRFDPKAVRDLREILAVRKPDILQSHNVKSHFFGRIVAKDTGRWIAFQHGYTTPDLKMRAYNQIDRWSLPAAARVIAVCGPFAQALARRGVNPAKLSTLHNSISGPPAATGEEVEPLRARWTDDPMPIILSVGRLSSEKGHADYLDGLAIIRRSHPDLRFRAVLLGDGPERDNLQQRATRLGLSDRVLFEGQKARIGPYYRVADLFVLPSFSEGSPNVLLEAMAAQVPIVATAVGGIPEMVAHEREALLVKAHAPAELAAAMSRLLTDRALGKQLVESAFARVQGDFSPDAYARSLIAIYQQVLRDAS